MPKFEFSLERVLNARRQQEKMAEAKQLRAQMALRDAYAALDEALNKQAAWSASLAAKAGQPLAVHEWQADCNQSAFLQQNSENARLSLKEAKALYQAACRERADVATEVEALKTLREQQREEFQQEQSKLEQERVDEAGLRRYLAEAGSENG